MRWAQCIHRLTNFCAGAAFGLGDFGFVVGEDVVDPSAMDIEAVAEEPGGHGAAFDVPTGAAGAPGAVPFDVAVVGIVGFPEGEVADAFFFVFVGADAAGGAEFFEVEVRELSVGREAGDAEVNGLVLGLVSVTVGDQLFDHGDHAGDVLGVGGGGEAVGRFDAEGFEVGEEGVLERLREGGEGDAFFPGAADGFVVDVGEIHDAFDRKAAVFKVALEEILEEVGAEIADVGVVVDGGAARVELDHATGRVERDEGLEGAGQGVVEVEQGSCRLRVER